MSEVNKLIWSRCDQRFLLNCVNIYTHNLHKHKYTSFRPRICIILSIQFCARPTATTLARLNKLLIS